ncbi:MAG: sulfotransferase [Parvularculaceae bacterium]|nr:sulfotransferase [Parvularculaceae bacterium]
MTTEIDSLVAACRQRLAAVPDDPDAWFDLGYWLRRKRDYAGALDAYARALTAGVERPEEAHVNRAAILLDQLGKPDESRAALEAALALRPDFMPALINLGQLHEDLGDFDEARAVYQRILSVEPTNGRAHARIARLDAFQRGDAEATAEALVEALVKVQPRSDDAAELCMALGQALESAGRYDESFDAYQRANALARALTPAEFLYAPKAVEALVDASMAAFREAKTTAPGPASRPAPIFVCGLLRSGSTLTERILARHPRVSAGGELEFVPAAASRPGYPASALALGPDAVAALRAQYYDEARSVVGDFDVIVDKRPENFLHLGLIKTLFPDARIVNTVRDAGDVTLSIFANLFGPAAAFANTVPDIAHWRRQHDRLMAHWRELWPNDILTLDYDDLVAAPETVVRRLLDHCGLDWDPSCVTPPSGRNFVRTLSQWQVREPIHTRSSGRAKPYLALLTAAGAFR